MAGTFFHFSNNNLKKKEKTLWNMTQGDVLFFYDRVKIRGKLCKNIESFNLIRAKRLNKKIAQSMGKFLTWVWNIFQALFPLKTSNAINHGLLFSKIFLPKSLNNFMLNFRIKGNSKIDWMIEFCVWPNVELYYLNSMSDRILILTTE